MLMNVCFICGKSIYTGCIRKNCAVGSFGTISEPDGLSSQIIYQMKAEIDIQNWVNFMRIRLTQTDI